MDNAKQMNPELAGVRVRLRKHRLELAQKMFEYVQRDRSRLGEFLPWVRTTTSVDSEVEYIKGCLKSWEQCESADYGIFRLTDDVYMGNVNAFRMDWKNEKCEIGYWILSEFEGQGFIREAVAVLEGELFQMGFNRIVIMCAPENRRSKSIPVGLGYSFEGTLRDNFRTQDGFVSSEVFSKLRSEFAQDSRA